MQACVFDQIHTKKKGKQKVRINSPTNPLDTMACFENMNKSKMGSGIRFTTQFLTRE